MKKFVIGICIIVIGFAAFIIYNHKQEPTKEDVFHATKDWSPRTEDVYYISKINGDWLTIFKNQNSIMIGQLRQNWLGSWEIRDESGNESTLASTYTPPDIDDDITWSAEVDKETETSYYFGQVINSKINTITVETKEDVHEDVPLLTSNGGLFFFKRVKGQVNTPINIRGFSKTGELLFSTLPE
ncbi:hypothetical protein SAMN05216389_101109 [Oceanobacillus limi]|uniref:Uncharacterized protein n=1 Tax=Oceanobacillus limi TaxID=930131 RepID=A0A1H9Y0W3_9BACI|nr:hypothetical protein [Oceanobacillus limi]SES62419.1 hypothetical protein SAMN05216389_101109 [Oceanobacillus limi]